MRSNFDRQLYELNAKMIHMGALCEEAIMLAVSSLVEGNTKVASTAAVIEDKINHQERDIEDLCLRLLLQQQPVARDLRQISAALKMITDMERIGDQAQDIAEVIKVLGKQTPHAHDRIHQMAAATAQMVNNSVEAYVQQDEARARKVIGDDDIVDQHFTAVKEELINLIAQDPTQGEYALDILMIAKYFERIGDHAVNIAEWVLFSILGTHEGELP